jgi:NADH-quinone oxidoreductase subunit F
MDLRYLDAEPTQAERAAVDAVVGAATSGWRGGARSAFDTRLARAEQGRRHLLLPALHALQDRVGWVSPGGLNHVCRRLEVPPADAYGVASFYALLALEERPPRQTHRCTDVACMAAAGGPVAVAPGEHPANCLGLCDQAPAALTVEAGEAARWEVQGAGATGAGARAEGTAAVLLARIVAGVDPTSLDAYRAAGGYAALRRAIAIGPAAVIAEVSAAGLRGRGGAAFPTGRKWAAVAQNTARPHYLVANADESEPGTFKDRVLMEGDPFALVEALTIAGFATGAATAVIYLRGEYGLAHQRLSAAIDQCRARGLLGADVMAAGFGFDIEIRRGAGAYICGEETALFNSIEGFRGEPRSKPPFPVDAGLFGKPTVVNNVETLVNVLPIVTAGGDTYAATGTPESTGTRLFCLSGALSHPGVVEVPHGYPLRALLANAGVANGGPAAVLVGGAAGSLIGPHQLDVALSFEGAAGAGVTLGSGVVCAFAEGTDLFAVLRRISHFFRDESCGQCVPCRVGTVRQDEALARLAARWDEADVALLADVAQVMRDASICGLGQTAASVVQSAVANVDLGRTRR